MTERKRHTRERIGRNLAERDNGKIELRKYWPDGTQIRRTFGTRRAARRLRNRIEEAIASGTWRELKDEMVRGRQESDVTVKEFAQVYLEEYCKTRNRRPDWKEQTLRKITAILGDLRLRDLRRAHVWELIEKSSREGITNATINGRLAVLKNLLTFAIDKELLEAHPLTRFKKLPVVDRFRPILTLAQERRLVEATAIHSHVVGAFVAILGETGLRKGEGLRLTWDDIYTAGSGETMLNVSETKSGLVRHVPLTRYAREWLAQLSRKIGDPHLFLWSTFKPMKDPRGALDKARKDLGLDWLGFHDLRRFRATQWVKHGVDLRTVQELLGHANILTTMIYAQFAPKHANRKVHDVEELEREELARIEEKQEQK